MACSKQLLTIDQERQTKVVKIDQDTQTDFFQIDFPQIEYGDDIVPIHPDALRMIPKENVYRLIRKKSGDIVLHKVREVRKSLGVSFHAKISVTNSIIKRISPRKRQRNRDLNMVMRKMKPWYQVRSFRMTNSHAKLTHHYMLEYMVKGKKGFPVVNNMLDPEETDDEFEKVILKQNAQNVGSSKNAIAHKTRSMDSNPGISSQESSLSTDSDDDSIDIKMGDSSSSDEDGKHKSKKCCKIRPKRKKTELLGLTYSDSAEYPNSCTCSQ